MRAGSSIAQFLADWKRICCIAGKRFETELQPGARLRLLPPGAAGVPVISSTTSSATPCRRRGCAPASGNPSSRTTCAATAGSLYQRMGDFPTLITGPSGTRKGTGGAGHRRLRAMFRSMPSGCSSPTRRANILRHQSRRAFSDADRIRTVRPSARRVHRGDRATAKAGWNRARRWDRCSSTSSARWNCRIQVKLLRAIETRRFSAVGDTALREFSRQADRGHQSRSRRPRSGRAVSAKTSITGSAPT